MASKRRRRQAWNLLRFKSRSGTLSETKFEIVSFAARMHALPLLRIAQMRRTHEIERRPSIESRHDTMHERMSLGHFDCRKPPIRSQPELTFAFGRFAPIALKNPQNGRTLKRDSGVSIAAFEHESQRGAFRKVASRRSIS
jgi:hypothetical protein